MNKTIPVCYGHDVFTSYLLYEVKYHSSFEEAVGEANKYRNLARVDKYRIIQVGYSGDNIMVFKYEPKIVSWAVTSTPVWSEKQIEKFSNQQHLKHHQQFENKTLREICGMPSGSIGNHGNTYGIIAEDENTKKHFVADTRHIDWFVIGRGESGSTILRNPDLAKTDCPKCKAKIQNTFMEGQYFNPPSDKGGIITACTKCDWVKVENL
jgi:hypothetical protein